MVHYLFNCFAIDSSISRQQYRTVHIFSILTVLGFYTSSYCQHSSEHNLPSIVRIENINKTLNKSNLKNNLKVIHFGDSHIQGDRITGEIRKNLQQLGGNGGSGVFFPYSLCKSFGPIGTKSNIIGNYSFATFLKNPKNYHIGPLGYTIIMDREAEFSIEFDDQFRGKRSNKFSILTYERNDSAAFKLLSSGKLLDKSKLDDHIYKYTFITDEIPAQIKIKAADIFEFWGIEFINDIGICYEQYGVVGAQFTHLLNYRKEIVSVIKNQKPDLIIFSYGTNESYFQIDSISYENNVINFIQEIAANIPNAALLITNAPDTRSGGNTPSSELLINRTLSRISEKTSISYYDLNNAMGGWGSQVKWQAADLFSKDQLHFNNKGATLIGQIISWALIKGCNLNDSSTLHLEKEIFSSLPSDSLKASNLTPEIKNKTSKYKTYIIKEGDTLSNVAKKFKTTVKRLCELNNISEPDKIQVGKEIRY